MAAVLAGLSLAGAFRDEAEPRWVDAIRNGCRGAVCEVTALTATMLAPNAVESIPRAVYFL